MDTGTEVKFGLNNTTSSITTVASTAGRPILTRPLSMITTAVSTHSASRPITRPINMIRQHTTHIKESTYKMSMLVHDAAKRGDAKEVQKLLTKSSVDPNKTDWNGWAPLHYAACQGHNSTCEVLLQHKANVNVRGRFDGMTPLMCAAQNQHWQTCQLLVEHHADKRATDVHFMSYTDYASVLKPSLQRQMTI